MSLSKVHPWEVGGGSTEDFEATVQRHIHQAFSGEALAHVEPLGYPALPTGNIGLRGVGMRQIKTMSHAAYEKALKTLVDEMQAKARQLLKKHLVFKILEKRPDYFKPPRERLEHELAKLQQQQVRERDILRRQACVIAKQEEIIKTFYQKRQAAESLISLERQPVRRKKK